MARAGFLRRVLRAIGREIGEGAFSSAAAIQLFQYYSRSISQNAAAATSTGGEQQSPGYPIPPVELARIVGLVDVSADSWKHHVDTAWEELLSMLGREVSAEWCVLEPGCGCGRLALSVAPLVRSYIGFDVNPDLIAWCRENIPQGEFHHVDAKNEMYNPGGITPIRFPCEDAAADLIYMASVVTHLRRGDFEEFLRESARCLKPGGVMIFSCYLQSSAVHGLHTVPLFFMGDPKTESTSFNIIDEVSWVDSFGPDSNTFIVYDGDWITRVADSLGLVNEKTLPGPWGGIVDLKTSYSQDWILLRKR